MITPGHRQRNEDRELVLCSTQPSKVEPFLKVRSTWSAVVLYSFYPPITAGASSPRGTISLTTENTFLNLPPGIKNSRVSLVLSE